MAVGLHLLGIGHLKDGHEQGQEPLVCHGGPCLCYGQAGDLWTAQRPSIVPVTKVVNTE